MTTNYTHIINDNLDMFDTTETISLAEEWEEMDADERFEKALREQREKVMAMDETDEGYAMEMAIYSDMYKDMYGHRPYGIGLHFHGM